jgi:hypothetical protein
MMSENSAFGGPRVRARAARTIRATGAVAAAAVALAGTALSAGAAPAASAAAGGRQPRAALPVDGGLFDVTAISSSNAWAVGGTFVSPTTPILAHWDGKKWAQVKSPTSLGELDAVAKFPGGAWAVGFSGEATEHLAILRLTGTMARRVETPKVGGGFLFDVSASSATNAWAVGRTHSGQMLALHWNGTRWTRTPLPAGSRLGSLDLVATASKADAWAIGEGTHGNNIFLHWNGKRWSRAVVPANRDFFFLRAITATSASNAWIVGSTGSGTGAKTVILHWNGKKWTRVPSPNRPEGNDGDGLFAVAASSARSAWAVGGASAGGGESVPLIERWNGTTWKLVSSPVADGRLEGISISPSGRAWAVGQAPGTTGQQTLIMHWDGKAWH